MLLKLVEASWAAGQFGIFTLSPGGEMKTTGQETMVFPSGPGRGPCHLAVFYLLTSAGSRNKNFTAKGQIRNQGSFIVEK